MIQKENLEPDNNEAKMKTLRSKRDLRTRILPVLALSASIALISGNSCPAFADDVSSSQQTANVVEAEIDAVQAVPDGKGLAAGDETSPAFTNRKQELSYALGMNLGNRLRSHTVDVDITFLIQGLEDARSGTETLLTLEQARAAMSELQSEVRKDQTALGSTNKQDGEAFLAKNKAEEGVSALPSGLQYKVVKAGHGPKPTLDDTVVAHYRGTLIDGTVFDSSYERGQPSTLPVKGVIAGWREALQLMPVGSHWQLFIPADLAYGERAVDRTIGPNTTLVFEVELISIKDVSGGITMASANGDSVMSEVSAKLKQASNETVVPAAGLGDVKVSYKLDPRITQSLYMGERWASPRTYNCVNTGTTCTVEAKVEAVDAKGAPMKATPEWISADPKIVMVSPDRGNKVKITVLQAGETSLKVTAGEFSKELFITAKYEGNKIKAGISRIAPSPQ
jgi:FKBP-type peptidyl-prolyl cis-trans isomerase FklB